MMTMYYDAMAHSELVAAVIASELAKERGGNVATDDDVAHGEDLLNNFFESAIDSQLSDFRDKSVDNN